MRAGRWQLFILMLFLLTGCAGAAEPSDRQSQGQPAEETAAPVLLADWKREGFALEGQVKEEQSLWIESYVRWEQSGDGPENTFLVPDPVYDGKEVYVLYPYIRSGELDTVGADLEIFDLSSMTGSLRELTPEQLGLPEGEDILGNVVVAADAFGEQELAVMSVGLGLDEAGEIVKNDIGIARLGKEGETERTDLLAAYQAEGILRKNSQVSLGSIYGECIVDGEGNSYIRWGDERNPFRDLYVFDRAGEAVMEYQGSDQEQVGRPMKTQEGELIFPAAGKETGTRLLWLDLQSRQPHVLAELEGESITELFGMQGNELYYGTGDGIVRWNVESGVRTLIFDYSENGMSGLLNQKLLLREEGTPVLLSYGEVNGEREYRFALFSEKPVERADSVRIASLTGGDARVKSCAAVASRRNPNYGYVFQDSAENRDQILAELIAGGGPELLYVSREDMEMLWEKGLLEDLSAFLPQEALARMIPSAVELGTLDAALAGIPSNVEAVSLVVGDRVWEKDSWTWKEFLEKMEQGETLRLLDGGTFHSSANELLILLEYSLEDPFFIDWERRESHFGSEEFVRLLKAMGRYTPEEPADPEALLAGGAPVICTAACSTWWDAASFRGARRAPGLHYVGFPTKKGNGSYLYAKGFLVVRKNISQPKAVSAYLECLLSEEVQEDQGRIASDTLPVVYLPTEEMTEDLETGALRWYGQEVVTFEDGATSVQEVNSLLEKCVPGPRSHEDLMAILGEEVTAYFDGGRTAEETARIIDNRVQLYLDEAQ